MKSIVDILKQFNQSQRVLVLVLLLVTILLTQYFKTDECSSLIDENLKMQEDFVTISQMLREERLGNLKVEDGAVKLDTIVVSPNTIIDEVLLIVESNIKDE